MTRSSVRTGFGPEAAAGHDDPAGDEPEARQREHDAPFLDRHERESVRVQERHERAAEEVVEHAEQEEREQTLDGADRADRAPEVDEARAVGVWRGRWLVDPDRHQVDQHQRGEHDGDEDAPAHAEHADGEAAEDRRNRERDAARRADQPVRAIVSVLRDEEGHRRGQGDHPEVSRDRPDQDQRREHPEREVPEVSGTVGRQEVDKGRERERREGQAAREEHRRPAPMPVDERPEEHPRDREQQHVAAADDRGCDHRPGLEVDPERQGEPQEVVGDARDERVRDEQVEGAHHMSGLGRRGELIVPDVARSRRRPRPPSSSSVARGGGKRSVASRSATGLPNRQADAVCGHGLRSSRRVSCSRSCSRSSGTCSSCRCGP